MNTIKGVFFLAVALVALLLGSAIGGAHIAMVMHYVGVEVGWFAASAGLFGLLAFNTIVKAVAK